MRCPCQVLLFSLGRLLQLQRYLNMDVWYLYMCKKVSWHVCMYLTAFATSTCSTLYNVYLCWLILAPLCISTCLWRWQWTSFRCGEISSNCNGGSKLGPSMNLLDLGEFVTVTNAQQIFGACPTGVPCYLKIRFPGPCSYTTRWAWNVLASKDVSTNGGLRQRTPKLILFQFDEHTP